jgi:uncharacterized protein YuzE
VFELPITYSDGRRPGSRGRRLISSRDASAVENVVIERPGRGDIVLDFDADGRLLGVEVIGATELLRPAAVTAAIRIWVSDAPPRRGPANGSWRARAVNVTAFGQMWRAGAA